MQEMIGKVRLNLNWYNGEDRYSDGDSTENELLSIVGNPQKDYNDIIAERGSWPVLYHLSPVRENIVNWYPFRKGARVLELGSGCGAVTGALLSAGLDVCAVDLSLRRSRINATRHQDSDRLEIIVGAMEEVLSNLTEQFDYVLLIGVLEYASVFSDRDNPYAAVLTAIKKVLKSGGEVLVAIENKLGLKYLAGCREDHTGRFFESIEGYPHADGPKTFSRSELRDLADACGYESEFYYPYPDYKFPLRIYSDAFLPGQGEWNRNWQNFDADRVALFNEQRAADTLISAGLITEFANSFLLRLFEKGSTRDESVIYAKMSTERKPEYRQSTIICKNAGAYSVRKVPASKEACGHLFKMTESYRDISARIPEGCAVSLAPCKLSEDGSVEFEYLKSGTLNDRLSKADSAESFLTLLKQFYEALKKAYGTMPFEKSEGFTELFGEQELPEGFRALCVTDLDLNYDNVFIGEDGTYRITDYEWVFPFAVPLPFLIYRALLVNPRMAAFGEEDRNRIFNEFGIGAELRDLFFAMELRFQEYVSGKNNKLEEFRNREITEQPLRLDEMIAAGKEIRRLSGDLEEYRGAYDTQSAAYRKIELERNEYRDAYDRQVKASNELTRQRDEYHAAYDRQAEAVRELNRQRDEYRNAYDEQSAAYKEIERQRDEYHKAYDDQTQAANEIERQKDEYRRAYDEQVAASNELTRQRDEYHRAYDEQVTASGELTRQRDEYRTGYDEAMKRALQAEEALAAKSAEFDAYVEAHTHWRNKKRKKND
ncbi:MAG: methyltransferase domain-containing protein [Lachnospiraceae bacterium]|nr:methyltransferase domain-containing protein [Lachnospiraceae bacterium]